jgi:hypothetical protein
MGWHIWKELKKAAGRRRTACGGPTTYSMIVWKGDSQTADQTETLQPTFSGAYRNVADQVPFSLLAFTDEKQ